MKQKILLLSLVLFGVPIAATPFSILNQTDGRVRTEIYYVAPSLLCANDVRVLEPQQSALLDTAVCIVDHLTFKSETGTLAGQVVTPAGSGIGGIRAYQVTIINQNGSLAMDRRFK